METKNKEVAVITKYDDRIEQVHSEFDSAHKVLIEQAKKIISGTDDKVEKAIRLQKAGFGKVVEVKENEQEARIKLLAEQTARIVEYYSRKYPLNKFITSEQVMIIAEKYNLVLGNVSDFIGFVPDKNLREIEKFKCDEADKEPEYSNGISNASALKIVAPEKDFDMTGKRVQNRVISEIPVPDPIVLQPVKYGFLILTAWGDEASDPIVVNNINN